jgi:hypothetical protein
VCLDELREGRFLFGKTKAKPFPKEMGEFLVLLGTQTKAPVLGDEDCFEPKRGCVHFGERKLVVEEALNEPVVKRGAQVVLQRQGCGGGKTAPEEFMEVPIESTKHRVNLVLYWTPSPVPTEVLLDRIRDLLRMGQPEEIQQPRSTFIFNNVRRDLQEEIEVDRLGFLESSPVLAPISQGAVDSLKESEEGKFQPRVELHEKDRLGLGRFLTLREGGKGKAKEVLNLLNSSLDEARR